MKSLMLELRMILFETLEKLVQISNSPELNMLYESGEKFDALENLMKRLNMMTLIIEKQMYASLDENKSATNSPSVLVNTKKTQETTEYIEQLLKVKNTDRNDRMTVDIEDGKFENRNLNERISILDAKLRTEINLMEFQYEKLEKINIAWEKNLFTAKKNSEQRYLETLDKYDQDVGSLYQTMKSLIEVSTLLDGKLKNLEADLSVQEKIYEELKTEREREIMAAFARDMENFTRNRAAKIIQRTWKKYLEKLLSKRKKKSKKKR